MNLLFCFMCVALSTKVGHIYKLVHYGINREARDTVYTQLLRDVAAVRYNGVYRYIKLVGNLFVGEALCYGGENIALARRKLVYVVAGRLRCLLEGAL